MNLGQIQQQDEKKNKCNSAKDDEFFDE